MIIRNDIRSSLTVIPQSLKDTLLRCGGTNAFGEPMYRLLRAEDRITKAAGAWNIWAEDASLDDRGGLGIQTCQQMVMQGKSAEEISEYMDSKLAAHPLRVDRGMADIELYPYEGFIIEKWKPADQFGSQSDWYSFTFEGEPALGPYPQYGEYELCAGPTPYMPSAEELENAVRQDFRQIESRPRSPKERVRMILAKVDERQKAMNKQRQSEASAKLKDGPASLRNVLSLGAGRVIQDLATKQGLKGHYGN